ncbi:4Fe-4S binding protein [Azohydromonas lata]|uniref:4Fe-4S binding protein n=1 Tax=Azohydromonas lata TaxID=45677 RepID=A0ABU5I824_9BURK|nr:4Fe-4S binding protein [Azohydromonas lata]MDZ5455234.1 4Fe-4S binding protein [Azohydromonas lata]
MTIQIRLPLLALVIATLLVWWCPVHAATEPAGLDTFLPKVAASDIVPGADRFGPVRESPRVAPAYRGNQLLGYVYLNSEYVDANGYSGKPIHILVGLDTEGTIVGVKLVAHSEPIVLIGIPERKVVTYLQSFVGYNPLKAAATNQGPPHPDIVSGATVTVLVMGETVVRSAVRVARALSTQSAPTSAALPQQRTVDSQAGAVVDWNTLLNEGAVRHLHLTVGQVNKAFVESGNKVAAERPEPGPEQADFIDLYAALVSQPAIGRSLLGDEEYASVSGMLAPGQQAILVAGDGLYSFKGSGYVRGGIFDRIELIQGAETIRFRDRLHRRVGALRAAGAPELKEIGVFLIPAGTEFDPAGPWRLQLLVQRSTGALEKAFVSFMLPYELPRRYTKVVAAAATAGAGSAVAASEPRAAAPAAAADVDVHGAAAGQDGPPLWKRLWTSKAASVAVLAVMLAVLTLIFFFQDALVKREKLYDRVRLIYLAVTLVWLGWMVQAQLSVVNVLTFTTALRTGFQWSSFLIDPLVFILWCSVAAALLFWGRGPFCGWLCPFGALQELSNRAARALKVPQLKIPWRVHERLWPLKYIIFLGLFGVSLGSLAVAEMFAEVEPFKTAIILRFMREWWFVAFAVALLVAGLFVERFFCRYLCPLGAALAIPGRIRMFDWLKRYRECGNPCMRCFKECPVEAIHPEGHINPNECISCLHCQVLYHHEHKCPVLIQRRLKRERRSAMAPPLAAESGAAPSVIPIAPAGTGQPGT